MSDDVTITRWREGAKGGYRAAVAGVEEAAELTYSISSPTLIIADHTGVPDALRGRGLAEALYTRLVADARAEGVKIIPLCPFVKAQSQKRPEDADVFK